MIIFGLNSRTISTFRDGDTKYTVTGRYFHIFWLAVFPIGKKLISEGPDGAFEYNLDDPEVQRMVEQAGGKTNYGPMFFLFWIVGIIVVGAWQGYKFFNNRSQPEYVYEPDTEEEYVPPASSDPEMDEIDKANFVLINDPQVGDYWIMKFPEEDFPFVVYRIQRLVGDSIYCWSSNSGYAEGTEASAAIRGRVWEEKEDYWYEKFEFGYHQDELKDLYYTNDENASEVKGILFYPFRLEE